MARLFEKSSGGIVYRKHEGKIQILLLEWENSRGEHIYVLPKWKMEGEEKALETALREIGEETWLPINKLKVIKFMTKVSFSFVASHIHGRPLVNKDMYLFLVHYVGDTDPILEIGKRFYWFRWFDIEELPALDLKPDVYSYVKKNIQYM